MPSQGFGKSVGVACASFAITNIDAMFILITFFSEATTSKTLTPFRIVLGQYTGFTFIITISLIGFGLSFLFPVEPIGFMGFLPILLGIWRALSLIPAFQVKKKEEGVSRLAGLKSVSKVAIILVMSGADNIGTYVPLFSQANKVQIAIYIVTYYILLGVWCLAAYVVMRERHILALARKYVPFVLPFLYVGLGMYIIIGSSCFPWSIQEINGKLPRHPGKIVMGVVTTSLLVLAILAMIILKRRKSIKNIHYEGPSQGTSSPIESKEYIGSDKTGALVVMSAGD